MSIESADLSFRILLKSDMMGDDIGRLLLTALPGATFVRGNIEYDGNIFQLQANPLFEEPEAKSSWRAFQYDIYVFPLRQFDVEHQKALLVKVEAVLKGLRIDFTSLADFL